MRCDWYGRFAQMPEKNAAAVRAAVAKVSAQSEGWSASRESARRCQRNLLSVANGLPVESIAAAVRCAEYGASVLSGMEPAASLPPLLEKVSTNVGRTTRNRMALASVGWLHDQGAVGRGKKPAKTPPIAVSSASSDPS